MGQYNVHVNGAWSAAATTRLPGESQYYAYDSTRRSRRAPRWPRRALPLLDLQLPGPRQPPGHENDAVAAQAGGATQIKVASVASSTWATRSRSAGRRARAHHGHERWGPRAPATGLRSRRTRQRPRDRAGGNRLRRAVRADRQGRRRSRRRHQPTFVTDGTWKIAQAAQYTNTTVTRAPATPAKRRALRRARRDRRAGTRRPRRLGLAAGLRDRHAPRPNPPRESSPTCADNLAS